MREPTNNDGRLLRGQRSREKVLAAAIQLASTQGLHGLSFGVLADLVDTPKSSISALFRTKEKLQLVTVEYAAEVFTEAVIRRVDQSESAADRLSQLGEYWFDYLDSDTFEGGCFFLAAAAEMDGRPGAVRDSVVVANRRWLDFLTQAVGDVFADQHISDQGSSAAEDVDSNRRSSNLDEEVAEVAFRLNSAGLASNFAKQLLGDNRAISRGRRSWQAEVSKLEEVASLKEPDLDNYLNCK